ncbi:hypothetical protein [Kitasatospora brasiliensis]|uniref:hypothetical protein n=1 Tax=Kitasatospora brasiliensis TaxID=3058040 RepID=UPI00292D53C6|nr:hypothetical protein [Kitasatospora sp. K002]
MNAEDRFEEELVTRLGTHAAGVGGTPPLAELHEAGQRRARRQTGVRMVTATAVVVAGVGVLTQLGGGIGPGRTGPAGMGAGIVSPMPSPAIQGHPAVMLNCLGGPTSMRTPGWHQHRTELPTSPSPSDRLTPWAPYPGPTDSGSPTTGPSSSVDPSSVNPSSGYPSQGYSSSRSTSPGAPSDLPSSAFPSTSESPSAGPGSTGSGTLSPSAGDPATLGAGWAGQQIESLGMDGYPDHYFGTCRDSTTNTLFVMRVPGSGLDAEVARMAAGWPLVKVTFADAVGSRTQLLAFLKRIGADTEQWRAKGVEIEGLTLAIDGTGVVVDTPQWQSAGADIKAKYGPWVAEVR